MSGTERFQFNKRVARFETNYSQLRVSLRQACAQEVLFVYSKVNVSLTSSDPQRIGVVVAQITYLLVSEERSSLQVEMHSP